MDNGHERASLETIANSLGIASQVNFLGSVSHDEVYSFLCEEVQWAVMEWAIDNGCDLYDLEGIDTVNNPGIYKYKKKMGGEW